MEARSTVRGCRAAALVIVHWLASWAAQAALITPELAAELALRRPQDEIAVIVTLEDRVDPRLHRVPSRSARDARLEQELREKARTTQTPHRVFLQNQGARGVRELWLINGMAVTARASVIRQLASRPGIQRIGLDSVLAAPAPAGGAAAPPEWNLAAVRAPELWSLAHTGAGVVVANLDTGVDPAHPDLAAAWRGGGNSWYDPHGQHPTPHDASGHGTQTMGIMVGGAAGGSAIGMAPAARWIAAKLYDDAGQARYSDIHLAFQWLLDPDGDPATMDAPDVVNASWGLAGAAGLCVTEFSIDIEVLRAAGIAVVFAAGNDGPGPLTSLSPANAPGALSSGAVDDTLTVAAFSSRGPSACDGTVYPKLVAPGVNIRTTDLSFGGLPLYAVVSGTSFAAPHAAGALALLASAFPDAALAQLEAALAATARDLGVDGDDNSYGHGLVDVQAAYQFLLAATGSPPRITSTPPTAAIAGIGYRYAATATDADSDALSYSLDAAPAGMSMDAALGLVQWTPTSAQVGTHGVTVRVTDATGKAVTQTYALTVSMPNRPPAAASDAYGMLSGTTLTVAAPGVLGNDTDADGAPLTAVLTTAAANGSVVLRSDGSFDYAPKAGFAGTDTFVYRAFDGTSYSSNAIVSIAVTAGTNIAPVARNDSVVARTRRSGADLPAVIHVLANDADPDGSIDPATVTITTRPSNGGLAVVNADGTVYYASRFGYRGQETFRYRVRDRAGAWSNFATVTVSVQ